jgi:serine/threonine protein kinase/Flp pilus assembly protein TadD
MKGRIISHYEVLGEVGRGGMGVVYRARDLTLNRFVALKALPLITSTDSVARQRFEREAQAASSLNHPNIVTIYDLVADQDASYIVMEFIEGEVLGDIIPPNGLPPERAIRYAIQLADALGSAHEAGIIHRDLKPQNILVSKRDQVKVLDFGVAKLTSEASGHGTGESLTRPGAFLGTTYYAAPEQFSGGIVDQRTDVYGLGVVLYQMVSGQVPFFADNTLDLLHAICNVQHKPLSQFFPHFPPIADQIIDHCLNKKAEGRYPDMAALAEDLKAVKEAFRMAEQVSSMERTQALDIPPDITRPISARPSSGRPSSVRSSYPPVWIEPPQAGYEKASIAVLPFRSLSSDKEDEYMAIGIGAEINSALSRVAGIRVASNLSTFRYRDEAPDLHEIAGRLKIRYVLTGSLRRAGMRIRVMAELSDAQADSVLWARTYERHVEDLFAVQEEIAESIVRATGGELIRAGAAHANKASAHELDAWGLVRKAYHFWNYGFHPAGIGEALELLRRAIELDPEYANAYAFLALYLIERVVLMLTDRPDEDRAEANNAANKAMELAPQDAEVLENVGLVWLHCGEYNKSVEALRRAVGVAPFNLVAWGYLGLALGWGGKERDALEAQKILTKIIADTPEHPSLPYWYFFLSGTYVRLRRYEDAVIAAQRCVELQPRFYVARITLANALGRVGRDSEARDEMANVLASNPYVSETLLQTEYSKIARDPEVAELHLAGLRAAQAMPQSPIGERK